MLDQQTVMILLAVGFTAIVMYMAAKNGKLPGVGKVSSKPAKKVGGDPFKPEAYAAQPMAVMASRDALTRAEAAQLEDRILQRVQEVVESKPAARDVVALATHKSRLDQLHELVSGAVEDKRANDAKMTAVQEGLIALGQVSSTKQ